MYPVNNSIKSDCQIYLTWTTASCLLPLALVWTEYLAIRREGNGTLTTTLYCMRHLTITQTPTGPAQPGYI